MKLMEKFETFTQEVKKFETFTREMKKFHKVRRVVKHETTAGTGREEKEHIEKSPPLDFVILKVDLNVFNRVSRHHVLEIVRDKKIIFFFLVVFEH